MKNYLSRTVTETCQPSSVSSSPNPLSAYDDTKAYVLLGAPGAGKTREFQVACEREANAKLVTARDFLALSIARWRGKTMFIDALDEMRGHSCHDPRRPLDRIRERLEQLDVPRFRLACRDADWLGRSDEVALNNLLTGSDETCILRLNPLTERNIKKLAEDLESSALVETAQQQGLGRLLENPLTLRLFVTAWKQDKWPDTICDAYMWGCRGLARERNEEHEVSDHAYSLDALLSESGLLSAIILFSGLDGIQIHGASNGDDMVALTALSGIRHAEARAALATRLFEVKDGVARPAHRQIAEFLAATYLAKRIDQGLSPNRVIHLLSDTGNRIAAPLRGVAAWLAVHCPRLRDRLVRLDPIGTVSYGDVHGFSQREKRKLLACLEVHSTWDPWTLAEAGQNARWAGLVTHDMAEEVKACLLKACSQASNKWLSYVLVDALRCGDALTEVWPDLRRVLVSNEHEIEMKRRVADVLIAQLPSSDMAQKLREVLDQLLEDPRLSGRTELVEQLLTGLYPRHISAAELPRYLILDQPEHSPGYFWGVLLIDHTESSDIPALLDGLYALAGQATDTNTSAVLRSDRFLSVFTPLLVKLLESGCSIPVDRLYPWLDAATANDGPGDDLRPVLVAWLQSHPDAYGAVHRKIMARSSDPTWDEYRMFGGFRPRGRGGEVRGHKDQRALTGIDSREDADNRLCQAVKRFRSELLENCGPPKLLSALVGVYNPHTSRFRGETPDERLLVSLGGDEALANAVTHALRQTPRRTDLPSAEEVIGLAGSNQIFALTDPYLTGLSMSVTSSEALPAWFDEREMHRALAFRLCALSTSSGGESPDWYVHLLENRPESVAEVFEKVAARTFRTEMVDFPRLYDLSRDSHEDVARLSIVPLLRKFPVRGVRNEKLYVLIHLMQVAFRFRLESKDVLLKLVEYKLARKSLAANQRVYWTCFGMGIDNQALVGRLHGLFVGEGRHRLLSHLSDFLYGFAKSGSVRFYEMVGIDAMKALVQLLGRGFNPDRFRDDSSLPRDEVRGSVIVNGLINALAQNPSPEAREALSDLARCENLVHLRERLKFEETRHRERFPESGFDYLEPKALLKTLLKQGAASSGDLAVIALDTIDELSEEIRHGDTSDWRQYWDAQGTPRYENDCRDAFLSDLRKLLPRQVRAEPEVQHADGKRCDIRVSQGEFEVSIEVKQSNSRDLWSAVSEQLVPGYTRSPRSDGHGILLVFWFGRDHCKPRSAGAPPETAQELQELLESGLHKDHSGTIRVRVVDVSSRP